MVGENQELQYFMNVQQKCFEWVMMGDITIVDIWNFISQ